MYSKITLFFVSLFIINNAFSQQNNIPIGEWRVHLPYKSVRAVETAGSIIYAGAEINGFTVDNTDMSIQILSKVNELNDIGINEIRYNPAFNLTMLGYENGNIDIIKDNVVTNLNDIERKPIVGSKKINHIYFYGDYAYLSCDFGVSVINLKKYEVKETYASLAPAGLPNKVFASTFSPDGDSIFIATERGVMCAKNSPAINLMDFSNWFTYGAANNISSNNIVSVCTFNNKIYTGVRGDSIYYLMPGNNWTKSDIPMDNDLRSLNISMGKLLVSSNSKVTVATDETTYITYTNYWIWAPAEAALDGNGKLWIADLGFGLITNHEGYFNPFHQPNGPNVKEAFRLHYFDNKIVAPYGGYNASYSFMYRPGMYNVFDNTSWKTYSIWETPGFPYVLDILNAAYNPVDNKLYFATHGFGILVANPDNTYSIIDDTISPLRRALPQPGTYVFVTDVEVDKNGNLWVANYIVPSLTEPSVHVKRPNGTWSSKSFGFEAARYPIEIMIDENDYKWIRLRPGYGGGVIVYNDKNNTYKYLTDVEGQGKLPNINVNTMATDKNGEVWIGTDQGIAVFYNPEDMFSTSSINAATPIYDGFPLLYNEAITCIEIDGGNRKWIGTKNGLWLFNDDGTEVLHNFTVENSPLLSNNIMDVEINEISGEVFIATDKGIVSYRGTATEAKTEHGEVKVFPNPVKPDFKGLIGISGLANDAIVKITDVYGNLVYETKAEGGTAVWNGKNYNGEKAKTGVYLIFSASEDGVETFVSKLAVVE